MEANEKVNRRLNHFKKGVETQVYLLLFFIALNERKCLIYIEMIILIVQMQKTLWRGVNTIIR